MYTLYLMYLAKSLPERGALHPQRVSPATFKLDLLGDARHRRTFFSWLLRLTTWRASP